MIKKMRRKDWLEVVIVYAVMILVIACFSSCKTTKKIDKRIEEGHDSIYNHGFTFDKISKENISEETISMFDLIKGWEIVLYDTSQESHPVLLEAHGTESQNTTNKEIVERVKVEEVYVHDTLFVETRDTVFVSEKIEKKTDSSTATNIYAALTSVFTLIFIFGMLYYVINKIL